jgi:hypothetical protein
LHHLVGALAQRHIEVADQLGAYTHRYTPMTRVSRVHVQLRCAFVVV